MVEKLETKTTMQFHDGNRSLFREYSELIYLEDGETVFLSYNASQGNGAGMARMGRYKYKKNSGGSADSMLEVGEDTDKFMKHYNLFRAK